MIEAITFDFWDTIAIDAGLAAGAPAVDITGQARDSKPDIGAYEWRKTAARIFLPVVTR